MCCTLPLAISLITLGVTYIHTCTSCYTPACSERSGKWPHTLHGRFRSVRSIHPAVNVFSALCLQVVVIICTCTAIPEHQADGCLQYKCTTTVLIHTSLLHSSLTVVVSLGEWRGPHSSDLHGEGRQHEESLCSILHWPQDVWGCHQEQGSVVCITWIDALKPSSVTLFQRLLHG